MIKSIVIALFLASLAYSQPPKFTYIGELKAGSASIAARNGCPTVFDWDGDGKKDLLLGQFDAGNIRFYRNTGSASQPALAPHEFLKAGGSNISLPSG